MRWMIGLVVAVLWSPVVEACTPSPPGGGLLWPPGGSVVPPNAQIWLSDHGLDEGAVRDLRLTTSEGMQRRLVIDDAGGVERDTTYTQTHLAHVRRASLMAQPSTPYDLSYVAGGSTFFDTTLRTSADPVVDPPGQPRVALGFFASGEAPSLVSSCSNQLANEFAVGFVEASPGTAMIRAWARYPDGHETTPHRVLPASEERPAKFTFWAADRGLPCVVAVAIGPSGLESAEVQSCASIGCTDSYDALTWSEERWARLEDCGVSKAAAGGCICLAAQPAGAPWLVLALSLLLVIPGRARGSAGRRGV